MFPRQAVISHMFTVTRLPGFEGSVRLFAVQSGSRLIYGIDVPPTDTTVVSASSMWAACGKSQKDLSKRGSREASACVPRDIQTLNTSCDLKNVSYICCPKRTEPQKDGPFVCHSLRCVEFIFKIFVVVFFISSLSRTKRPCLVENLRGQLSAHAQPNPSSKKPCFPQRLLLSDAHKSTSVTGKAA